MAISATTALRPLLVVPHTHWDREWYRAFEAYRYRLVKTLDGVLDSDLPYFLLDGQMVVVEDYLAIRPDRAATLKQRVAENRLGAGPWYVLPDEFLVSGESLVRNLLIGTAAMRELGASGAVGYLPDMFGHLAQMPQLLRGFGLDKTVVWRGVNPSAPRFVWRSPDGSEVQAAWLPLGYYQTMLIEDLPAATRREQLDRYAAAFGDAPVLLLSGADHMAPRRDTTSVLGAIAEGYDARIVPLATALEGPWDDVCVEGELRDPAKAYILPGVFSARTYLKQANAECQTLLERYVEPLSALAWIAQNQDQQAFLTYAWKELLKNHPHDSICGCSVDQVHREMLPRFDAVRQVGHELLADAVGGQPRPVENPPVFAFNPTPHAFDGWLDLTVEWPLASAPESVRLLDDAGAEVPVVVRDREDTEVFCAEIDFNPDWFKVRRFKLAARLALPALGGRRYVAQAGEAATIARTLEVEPMAIANETLRLVLEGDRLVLTDSTTGARFEDCHFFLDEGDAGDSYNFSPLAGDAPVRAKVAYARTGATGPHAALLEVHWLLDAPMALSGDRARRAGATREVAIVSRFWLRAGARRVEVETHLDNTVTDHRLRVVCGLGSGARPRVFAETAFAVLEREPVAMSELPVAKGTEAVMPEFAQGRFSTLVRDGVGLAIANIGLPEASLVETPSGWGLATTLLRSVGWLSRDDLRTRGGGAGPRFETPEAQCLGPQVFRYALVPFGGEWTKALPEVDRFTCPPKLFRAEGLATPVGFDLGDERLVLSALKRSEDGEALVLRVYNPTERAIAGTLVPGLACQSIAESNLAEESLGALPTGPIAYEFGPYAIKTWRLEPVR